MQIVLCVILTVLVHAAVSTVTIHLRYINTLSFIFSAVTSTL